MYMYVVLLNLYAVLDTCSRTTMIYRLRFIIIIIVKGLEAVRPPAVSYRTSSTPASVAWPNVACG